MLLTTLYRFPTAGAPDGGSRVACNLCVVSLVENVGAGSHPADKTEGTSALLNSVCSCFCIGAPAFGGERPNAEEETALATEKFECVDVEVSPAVSAAITRVVSPDPTPVGFCSIIPTVQSTLRVFPERLSTGRLKICFCRLRIDRSI